MVLGRAGDGQPFGFKEEVELAGWAPPKDWEDLVLADGLMGADESGVALMTHNFVQFTRGKSEPLSVRMENFISQARLKYPFDVTSTIPFSIIALACIKTRSPLPSEYWRQLIFSPVSDASAKAKKGSKKESKGNTKGASKKGGLTK